MRKQYIVLLKIRHYEEHMIEAQSEQEAGELAKSAVVVNPDSISKITHVVRELKP